MGSYNRVVLCGNLGRDAELRYTKGGTAVSTLNLATTDQWTDKATGEKKELTEWSRVIVWGKTAEALQEYLLKGKQVLVEGRLQTRKWTDKDGVERYTTEVKADRVVLLGSGKGGRREDPPLEDELGGEPLGAQQPASVPIGDDDIPF